MIRQTIVLTNILLLIIVSSTHMPVMGKTQEAESKTNTTEISLMRQTLRMLLIPSIIIQLQIMLNSRKVR